MMRFTRPVFFMAIAVAMVSSLATQAQAQTAETVLACEQFNAAIAEIDGAIVVSGIQAEETIVINPLEDFGTPATIDFLAVVRRVAFETPVLTLPSGTLSLGVEGSNEPLLFEAGARFTIVQLDINGETTEVIFGPEPPSMVPAVIPEFYSFQPDAELGNACGICMTSSVNVIGNEDVLGDEDIASIRIFDGDTLIGEVGGEDLSFIAAPGQTITRVEFLGVFIHDIQVAFCPDAPPVDTEVSNQECLAGIAAEIGALADAATDSYDAYALNLACYALSFSAKDKFYEEDGNRLSNRGSNVFTGAAYAICYLEHTGVEGTEDLVDRILEKLDQIVDDEIDYAIANGGHSCFIEAAEDYAELAEHIDEDLDNPVVATIAYKLAWAHAYFATY